VSLLAALLVLPLWALHVAAQSAGRPGPNVMRPASWARPVAVTGAPKLHWVADNLYRSAQPNAEGFKALAEQFGVRTVVSLRAFNADEELAKGLGLRLERFRIHTWRIRRDHVVGALRAVHLAMREGPVLLHCQHGADRTGMITALYRILYQGWSKEDALDEMRNGDFGFHPIWGNIPRYIRSVDVEQLKRDVGVP
jgi:protein tyrosine/serine phosphatase